MSQGNQKFRQSDLGHSTTRPGGPKTVGGVVRLPGNDVRYYFTLFAKYFSSFVRTTCTLSVSEQYLALGEIYLPFRAAVPISTTR